MALAFGVLLLNLRIAMRTISPRDWCSSTREGPIAIAVDRRRVQPVATAVAGVLAALRPVRLEPVAGLAVVPSRAAVRRSDPVLGQDISFYVFQLPFLEVAPRAILIGRSCCASALAAGAST